MLYLDNYTLKTQNKKLLGVPQYHNVDWTTCWHWNAWHYDTARAQKFTLKQTFEVQFLIGHLVKDNRGQYVTWLNCGLLSDIVTVVDEHYRNTSAFSDWKKNAQKQRYWRNSVVSLIIPYVPYYPKDYTIKFSGVHGMYIFVSL